MEERFINDIFNRNTGISGNALCPFPPSQYDVTYNDHNQPEALCENGYNVTFDYDVSGMWPNIYAEGRIVAVHVDENSTESLYYVLTDHLGSWEKVLDESKNTVQQTHFDPWGKRMSYSAWDTPQTQTTFTFDRGFTGHEHYDCIHVINANARLYDPIIGRFFSPDPFVQAPDFTQAYNRYSYCMNNPVMYCDEDGEFIVPPTEAMKHIHMWPPYDTYDEHGVVNPSSNQ